jgi:hypothetical protein
MKGKKKRHVHGAHLICSIYDDQAGLRQASVIFVRFIAKIGVQWFNVRVTHFYRGTDARIDIHTELFVFFRVTTWWSISHKRCK